MQQSVVLAQGTSPHTLVGREVSAKKVGDFTLEVSVQTEATLVHERGILEEAFSQGSAQKAPHKEVAFVEGTYVSHTQFEYNALDPEKLRAAFD